MGKGEIAGNKQFLLFLLCSLLKQIIVSQFVHIFAIISLFAAEQEKPKTGISGKGLNITCLWYSWNSDVALVSELNCNTEMGDEIQAFFKTAVATVKSAGEVIVNDFSIY